MSAFLPALFGDDLEPGDPRLELSSLPVKFSGLALPKPTESASSNYDASVLICSHLLAAFRGVEAFNAGQHVEVLHEVKAELRERKLAEYELRLDSIARDLSPDDRRTILRGQETGQWLSVPPSTIHGTELSATCDGCGQKFDVRHALQCKTGGLVINRHDEITDELTDLSAKALKPSMVRAEPRILPGRATETTTAEAGTASVQKIDPADRGDLLIRGLWSRATECIIDVRITDLDAASACSRDSHKVLESHEKAKKRKYLQACLDQRRHFSPFVLSTDGLFGKEAQTLMQRLAGKLADKWDRPYSHMCAFVRARMSIAAVRATHRCLRGSRVPASRMSNKRPLWEDQAALGRFYG